VIDANGKLLLPPFIDSHVHLDATLTAEIPNGMKLELYLMEFVFGQNANKP
jgi:cytosine/adenosine deaminase-related metal-dependent hydrolase